MSEADVAIREFLAESYENLDQFERDLVVIEEDPRDREVLGSLRARGSRAAPGNRET